MLLSTPPIKREFYGFFMSCSSNILHQIFSTGQEEVLNGNFVLDHDSKEFKFVFDDPSIEQWDELYLTDINPHFGINYHCRGDESMFQNFNLIPQYLILTLKIFSAPLRLHKTTQTFAESPR